MIQYFRDIRRKLMAQGNLTKYSLYALGEILLVVIGIVIALQIDNWNEERKARQYERFLLQEIATNLDADGRQIGEILTQRRRTQLSILRLFDDLNTGQIHEDTLGYDLGQLFTFERYYPIRTAYEVAKSNGLQISNQELRSSIASYYEYEQPRVMTSIQDIETVFTGIFEPGYKRHRLKNDYAQPVQFRTFPDPDLFAWLSSELTTFRPNHSQSLSKVERFSEVNNQLKAAVAQELEHFEP